METAALECPREHSEMPPKIFSVVGGCHIFVVGNTGNLGPSISSYYDAIDMISGSRFSGLDGSGSSSKISRTDTSKAIFPRGPSISTSRY